MKRTPTTASRCSVRTSWSVRSHPHPPTWSPTWHRCSIAGCSTWSSESGGHRSPWWRGTQPNKRVIRTYRWLSTSCPFGVMMSPNYPSVSTNPSTTSRRGAHSTSSVSCAHPGSPKRYSRWPTTRSCWRRLRSRSRSSRTPSPTMNNNWVLSSWRSLNITPSWGIG